MQNQRKARASPTRGVRAFKLFTLRQKLILRGKVGQGYRAGARVGADGAE